MLESKKLTKKNTMIYYIIDDSVPNHPRCKIGYTRNPATYFKRMKKHKCSNPSALYLELMETGDRFTEGRIHKNFEVLRIPGTREWFWHTGSLLRYTTEAKQKVRNIEMGTIGQT